ncbi:hypothetical protein M9978_16370 [Sphingomonas sp. MG17]|uniref:Uncharacterized protein n=1 Tax=Sphingomonas tagetis TaxID=2949092 RepID=A0A9X2HIU5_9SPHN|nr:hypothetical protein [Sphingomonas tagetis]MCP3732001.1 hypothetical protein [Sphingomonas tagetis]
MTWYGTGTIAVTNGSAAVVGTGTAFVENVKAGDALRGPDERLYQIASVNSATSITLTRNYAGSTASGQAYEIMPLQDALATLAKNVAELIEDYQDVVDNAGQGMFGDGSVGTPGMRFGSDQDTGAFRPGSNIMAFATGGSERVRFSSTGAEVTGRVSIHPTSNPTSVATARQVYIGESSANSAYNVTVGYFAESEVWKGCIQALAGGAGTHLLLNPSGGNVAIGKTDPGNYRLAIARGDNNLLQLENTVGNGTKITLIDQAWSAEIEQSQGNLIFKAGGTTERGRIDTLGNLLVGVASGSYHIVRRNVAAYEAGHVILGVESNAGAPCASFIAVSGWGANAANAAVKFGYDATTSRSLNAGGTVNVSGADYAEYMTKAEGCGTIAPGDVCGVDASGLLVTNWADAISFVVKSTDPSLVGGDTWASDLDPKPTPPAGFGSIDPGLINPDYASELEQYEDDLAEWEAAFEAARQTVDRIAFSGQVPLNVGPATLASIEDALGDGVGVYLVAQQAGTGITAAAVLEPDMTLPLYMRRLGKVWAVRDGRPIIDVQHG